MKHILLACTVALSLAACTTAQVGTAVQEGQLVCAVGPTVVSLSSTSGAAILAKGATKQAVDAVCALISGIAVSPPGAPIPSVTVALPPSITIPVRS